jgi:hypothetical protein
VAAGPDPDVIEITGMDSAEVGRLAAAHGYAKSSASSKLSWDPAAVSLDGMGIATLAIAVLGVLCISSGYSSNAVDRVARAVTGLRRGPDRALP